MLHHKLYVQQSQRASERLFCDSAGACCKSRRSSMCGATHRRATCRAKAGFGEVQAAVQGERQALGAARPRQCAGWWRRRGSQARAHPARGRAEGTGAEVLCELQPGRPAVGAALHVCAGAGGRWEDAARSTVPAVRGARRRRRRAGERGGGHATERLTQERGHAPSQPACRRNCHARSARVKMKLEK